MKCIRTKDGKIFEVSKICVPYQIIESWIDFNSQGRFEIIKQADTIEELCDYELHYNSENELVIRKCKDVNFNILKSNLKSGYIKDVKLAILTDKGLIFVAKMNDEGELGLL